MPDPSSVFITVHFQVILRKTAGKNTQAESKKEKLAYTCVTCLHYNCVCVNTVCAWKLNVLELYWHAEQQYLSIIYSDVFY